MNITVSERLNLSKLFQTLFANVAMMNLYQVTGCYRTLSTEADGNTRKAASKFELFTARWQVNSVTFEAGFRVSITVLQLPSKNLRSVWMNQIDVVRLKKTPSRYLAVAIAQKLLRTGKN